MTVDILEKELASHKDASASAQWAVELMPSHRFVIDRTKIREAATFDDKWVLEINDDTISLEEAACSYKSLMIIECCFRSLKRTQIKMMPMCHWVSRRIEAHFKICVLALLIERVAELVCGKPGTRSKTRWMCFRSQNFSI